MAGAIQDDKNRFPLFNRVKQDHDIKVYIEEQNKSMRAMGYTEHSFAHIGVVADRTAYILNALGVDDHTIDLALTAAWMHDLGNVINRVDHSQSGALMTFYLLDKMGIPAEDIAPIVRAIGNHDEGDGLPATTYAKTAPHEYLVKYWLSEKDKVMFERFIQTIRTYDDHAHKGADLAREILGELKLTDGTETDMICFAIYHLDDKLVVDSPMDEVLKDADVIHHCMNDLSKPIKEKEQDRFDKLCA